MRLTILALFSTLVSSCAKHEEIGVRANIGFCYWKIPANFEFQANSFAPEFNRTRIISVKNADGFTVKVPELAGSIYFERLKHGQSYAEIESDALDYVVIKKEADYRIFRMEGKLPLHEQYPFVGYIFETKSIAVGLAHFSDDQVQDMIEYCLNNKISDRPQNPVQ